ncbi:MAG: hypothetical protein ACI9T8_000425 [Candidatus Saccharimonadales bacterium]|jgi:hypothetical protein
MHDAMTPIADQSPAIIAVGSIAVVAGMSVSFVPPKS